MSTINDVVTVLKDMPQLKHIKENVLTKELKKLVERVLSDLIHVKTKRKLIPLPKYRFVWDATAGEYSDDEIVFEYNSNIYTYWVDDLKYNKKGQQCFVIVCDTYMCPLCGKNIYLEHISSELIKGGYSSQIHKGKYQAMCMDCAKLHDKGK